MKKILFLILFTCVSVFSFAQTEQKIYSDTVYSDGKIIITNYIINEKQEKVNIVEPTILALDLFLNLNPWFDWRYPHYGWYNPPIYIHRPWYIWRPPMRPVGPKPDYRRPHIHNNRSDGFHNNSRPNMNNRPNGNFNHRPTGVPGGFNRGNNSFGNGSRPVGRPSGGEHFGGRR